MSKPELTVSDGRAYATMGNPCELGCIYCHAVIPKNAETANIGDLSVEELREAVDGQEINVLIPVHDTEVFLVEGWLAQLQRLAELGRHIAFSTKLPPSRGKRPRGDERIEALREIDIQLREQGVMLHPSVSIPRFDARLAREIEPSVVSPRGRIRTAGLLRAAGLAVSIAIRPTLPFVHREELEELIENSESACEYYLTSPLFMTPLMKEYMRSKNLEYKSTTSIPRFMAGTPVETVSVSNVEKAVGEIALKYGKPVFPSAMQGIQYMINKVTQVASPEQEPTEQRPQESTCSFDSPGGMLPSAPEKSGVISESTVKEIEFYRTDQSRSP